jgi:hypothetical protein
MQIQGSQGLCPCPAFALPWPTARIRQNHVGLRRMFPDMSYYLCCGAFNPRIVPLLVRKNATKHIASLRARLQHELLLAYNTANPPKFCVERTSNAGTLIHQCSFFRQSLREVHRSRQDCRQLVKNVSRGCENYELELFNYADLP